MRWREIRTFNLGGKNDFPLNELHTLGGKKPFHSARLPTDKALYLQLKITESLKGIGNQRIRRPPSKSTSWALQQHITIHAQKKKLRASALTQRMRVEGLLPFTATTSFKAQRWTSWPHRDLGKRLRTRASENSRRTANSSAREVNRSSLKPQKTEIIRTIRHSVSMLITSPEGFTAL